ncbi:MAG: GNAT family N-acetyltransferase [Proteobacteria bacterium]|nr:GNAT family N-acetyltransferase [Pseudomonadota bacterium]
MALQSLTLTGRTVRLEPLSFAHSDELWSAIDPELTRWFPRPLRQRVDLEDFIAEALAMRAAGTAIPFVTILQATGRAIGSTRLANYERAHRRIEIGWTFIARGQQRSAVNTEAKLLMLAHAFEALDCLRVELKTDARNTQSREAILRLGAVEEGTFRSHMVVPNGRIRDSVYYSILAAEWPAVKAKLAARLQA